MKREEIIEMLPLYAMDALSGTERAQVEAGLKRYPELETDLMILLETAADLTLGLDPVAPPPALKGKILERIAEKEAAIVRTPPPTPMFAGWRNVFGSLILVLVGFGGYQGFKWMPWIAAFADPDVRIETLVDAQGKPCGRAVYRPDGKTLVWAKLPKPPAGKTYQLWGVNQTDHIGLNTYQGGLIVFDMPKGLEIVHITQEKLGGSPTPTQLIAQPVEN